MNGLEAMIKPQSWKGSVRQKQYNTWKANHYGGLKRKRQFLLKSEKETHKE